MAKKAEVIVVDVEKSGGSSEMPAVAKRLDERRHSTGAEIVDEVQITTRLSAAKERREQVLKEKVDKVLEHAKSIEEKKENMQCNEEQRKLAMSQSMKERAEQAEKKAKDALKARETGLTEYMKVLNINTDSRPQVA